MSVVRPQSARGCGPQRNVGIAGSLSAFRTRIGTKPAAIALAALVAFGGFPGTSATAAETDDIPPAPQLLPEDTLAFARIDDVEQMREDFAGSSMGKMLNDPKMKPFASEFYQTGQELFGLLSEQVGISLDELLEIPHGQVAIAVIPANAPDERDVPEVEDEDEDSPDAIRRRIAMRRRIDYGIGGVLIIDAGDNAERMMGLVARVDELASRNNAIRREEKVEGVKLVRIIPARQGRQPLEYFERDGVVVIGVGHASARDVLERWTNKSDDSTLADKADFTAVMARSVGAEETRPQLTFYADPYEIVERIIKSNGGGVALVWPLIEELGVGKIRGIGGSVFRGGEFFEDISHLHVLIDAPRDGFFGVLRPETGETVPPKWVPADVVSYTTIHWNFEATYDNVGKIVDRFQGEDSMGRFVESPLKKRFEMDFRKDVIEAVTGRYATLRWLQPPAQVNSATQLHALELKSPSKSKAVFDKVRNKLSNNMLPEVIGGTMVYFGRQGGGRNFPKQFRRPEPCFFILGNWIMFSDSRQLVERVIRANSGAVPRLAEKPDYELVSSELGGKLDGEDPFFVSFMRPSEYIRQVYDLIGSADAKNFLGQAGENNVVAKRFKELLDRNELPPFSNFEKYFAPAGTFAYDEANGIHFGSFTLRATE